MKTTLQRTAIALGIIALAACGQMGWNKEGSQGGSTHTMTGGAEAAPTDQATPQPAGPAGSSQSGTQATPQSVEPAGSSQGGSQGGTQGGIQQEPGQGRVPGEYQPEYRKDTPAGTQDSSQGSSQGGMPSGATSTGGAEGAQTQETPGAVQPSPSGVIPRE